MMYIKLSVFKVRDFKYQHQITVWPPRGCRRLLVQPQRPFEIMRKVYHVAFFQDDNLQDENRYQACSASEAI